jgi:hypothetical protein
MHVPARAARLRFLAPPPLAPAKAVALLAVGITLAGFGCSDRYAPDEAPPLSTAITIPTAAPNATGANFDPPKVSGVSTGRSAPPEDDQAVPTPKEAPEPLPLPSEPTTNPFEEPPPTPLPKEKGKGGAASGPLPKGVQL